MALLTSLGALSLVHASPPVHRCEREQMDFSAHFSRASTWVCLSAALWASEKMSFNEVSLITQFYGQPFCSVTRLDQNPNPYLPVRGMTSTPELTQTVSSRPVSTVRMLFF